MDEKHTLWCREAIRLLELHRSFYPSLNTYDKQKILPGHEGFEDFFQFHPSVPVLHGYRQIFYYKKIDEMTDTARRGAVLSLENHYINFTDF